jgi:hypothetical protein
MAVVVLIVVGALTVVAIGLLTVGRVVRRLGPEPARQVFEGDEALSFVAAALPDDVTAQLSYDDVGRILRLHLDFLHRQGVARSGGDLPEGEGPLVVEFDDAVDYVLRRGEVVGFRPERRYVAEVVTAQLAYFEAIGAVSEVEGPDLGQAPTSAPLGRSPDEPPTAPETPR